VLARDEVKLDFVWTSPQLARDPQRGNCGTARCRMPALFEGVRNPHLWTHQPYSGAPRVDWPVITPAATAGSL
jgi:hypothetical protein